MPFDIETISVSAEMWLASVASGLLGLFIYAMVSKKKIARSVVTLERVVDRDRNCQKCERDRDRDLLKTIADNLRREIEEIKEIEDDALSKRIEESNGLLHELIQTIRCELMGTPPFVRAVNPTVDQQKTSRPMHRGRELNDYEMAIFDIINKIREGEE